MSRFDASKAKAALTKLKNAGLILSKSLIVELRNYEENDFVASASNSA